MSIQHHSPEEIAAQSEAERRLLAEFLELSSKQFPNGRISKDDEGETAFAIATDKQNQIIRIQFSKPIAWIGLDLESAKRLHSLLSARIVDLEMIQIAVKTHSPY